MVNSSTEHKDINLDIPDRRFRDVALGALVAAATLTVVGDALLTTLTHQEEIMPITNYLLDSVF